MEGEERREVWVCCKLSLDWRTFGKAYQVIDFTRLQRKNEIVTCEFAATFCVSWIGGNHGSAGDNDGDGDDDDDGDHSSSASPPSQQQQQQQQASSNGGGGNWVN